MPAEIASCGRGCLSCAHVEMGGAAYVHVVSPLARNNQSGINGIAYIHTALNQPTKAITTLIYIRNWNAITHCTYPVQ